MKTFKNIAILLGFLSVIGLTANDETESENSSETEEQIETITVVATRTEHDLNKVPATVSVISAEQIERELSSNIADLIRYEPGVSVSGTGSRWGLAGFTIRGIGGNRVLTVVDGVRVPDEFSFGPFLSARRDFVDVDNLSRVEILRGPISVVHGSDALGGVVAFTSKCIVEHFRDGKNWFLETDYRFAQASETSSFEVALGAISNTVSAGIFINSERGHETQTAGTNDEFGPQRETSDPSEITTDNISLKLSFQVNPEHVIDVAIDNFKYEQDSKIFSDYGTSSRGTITESRDGIDGRNRSQIAFKYDGKLDFLQIDRFLLSVYQQSSETDQFTTDHRNSRGSRTIRTRRSKFEQQVSGFLVQFEKFLTLNNISHHIMLGWDSQTIDSEEIRWGATFGLDGTPLREFFPYPTRDFPLSTTTHQALFLQDEFNLFDGRVLISAGLRNHWYDVEAQSDSVYKNGNPGTPQPTNLSDDNLTAKLGTMIYLDSNVALYASLAQGFRAPPYNSLNVGFANPLGGYKTISNPLLESETSNGVEFGLRYLGETITSKFVVFRTNFENFIEDLAIAPQFASSFGIDPRDGLLTFQSVNRFEVEISGWELASEMNLNLLPSIQSKVRFAFGTAEGLDIELNQPLNSIDPTKAVIGVDLSNSKWNSSIVLTLVGDKEESDIAESTYSPLDGHTVVDVFGEYRIRENTVLNFGIFNLFSEEYIRWADVPAIGNDAPLRFSQPERHIVISVGVDL
ncbi:MAG: TonB-dependent receptor [Gammaproteobacteria bacterium]|nr:TonB-dependent receptor [Gammaproteobacteria bacterium]MDE0252982.1 TonB-dependent receptor [Gammaproteobacteria bacterium]MDE0403664.1 TonB-dependent receptor [Gammaproteobacteria bacterium]